MFSRQGKSTISQFLCFSNKNLKVKLHKEKSRLDLDEKVIMILKDRLKHTDVLNETCVNYDKNFANENTTAFRYIKNKQKLDLRTKNILKNIKKLNIVPPLGYYQPDYDFIKPRVSSVCFNKSRERKCLFSSQIQNEIPLKSKKSIFKTNNKRCNNLKRPRTNIINIKKRRSNQLSPAHSKTKYSINLFNDPIQSLSYCKAQTKSCISTNNRRSMSSMSNHIVSFIRNPIASSPKLSSSNTTLLSSN